MLDITVKQPNGELKKIPEEKFVRLQCTVAISHLIRN
jgi:hypothetical protein